MTSPSTIPQKFLSRPSELGVIAVGFSGGQVRTSHFPLSLSLVITTTTHDSHRLEFSPSGLEVSHTRSVLTEWHLQVKLGVEKGPQALLDAGLLTQLQRELAYTVHHDGTVNTYTDLYPSSDEPHRGMKNPRTVSAVTRKLSEQVYEHARQGRMVLTLGGDHSIAIGTISGTAKAIKERLGRDMAVIWVDAHADLNRPEDSPSGNVHGMPVAFLSGLATEDDEDIFGWIGGHSDAQHGVNVADKVGKDTNGEKVLNRGGGTHAKGGTPLSLKKLVYIGLRDVDSGEKKLLREHGIKAFSMHDVDKCVDLQQSSFVMGTNTKLGTVLVASWRWLLATLAPTRLSTCPSTWTPWIPSGRPAPAHPFVVD